VPTGREELHYIAMTLCDVSQLGCLHLYEHTCGYLPWEGGSSEGFVERVFKLKADVFIGGNGKVVGNREENRVTDWKVG